MTTQIRSTDLKKRSDKEPRKPSLRIPNLFGSTLRADVLALTVGLGRTYPRELARLVARPISMVQRAIGDLERAGVLATRLIGNQREVVLNPDYIASKELKNLVEALIEREPRYRKRLAEAARRRPRRTGKPL